MFQIIQICIICILKTIIVTIYINIYGNKKIKGLSDTIDEEIVLLGFLEDTTEKYFVTDI